MADQEVRVTTDAVPLNAEGVKLVDLANPLLRQWRIVVALPLVLAAVTGTVTLLQDREYSAKASFLPEVEGRGASGALALAQQFGVSMGADRPGQSPAFYVDLLQSPAILRQAVESSYAVRSEEGVVEGTLVTLFDIEKDGPLPPWRRAVEKLVSNVDASASRETGVVDLKVTAEDPSLAEQIAARLLALLNEFNIDTRQSRAQEEGRFVGARVEEARAQLRAAEEELQSFLRQNREYLNSPELSFTHDRLQRQLLMRQDLYLSLLRAQQQARIDAVRDTPLLTVIAWPEGSAEPEPRGTIVRTTLAFLFGLLVAALIAYVQDYSHRNREAGDPGYREFQRLSRQFLDEVRQPMRWMRRGRRRGMQ